MANRENRNDVTPETYYHFTIGYVERFDDDSSVIPEAVYRAELVRSPYEENAERVEHPIEKAPGEKRTRRKTRPAVNTRLGERRPCKITYNKSTDFTTTIWRMLAFPAV